MRTVFLFLLLTILPPLAAQEPTAPPRVERYHLDNGLTVLIERRAQLPLVNVTCFYRVGAANEVPGITGVAHYVEHMVFRGTENVSSADITGTFERIGGEWNAYTELDQTLYAETVPSWALDSALRIEAERMARATFDSSEFNRERGSVIAEINSYVGDPAGRLADLVRMTSFEIHPYRSNTLGYDVPAMTRDEAYRFYKDYYGPNNAVLVIAGDVDPTAARALVEKYFGGLAPAPRTPEIRVVEPPQLGEKHVVLIYPGAQEHVELAFRAPAVTHPDFPALLVLDAILSGARHSLPLGGGESPAGSRFEQAVEVAGGSGAGTTIQFSRYANLYGLRAKADPSVELSKVEAAIEAELDRVARDGVTADELAVALRRLKAARALAGDTLGEAAHRLAFFQALGSWALDSEIEQAAMRVTSADLQAFVRTWLRPEQRTVGIHRIGPAAPGSLVVAAGPRPAPAPFIQPSPVPPQALRPLSVPNIPTAQRRLSNGVNIRVAQKEGRSATVFIRLGIGYRRGPHNRQGLALLSARLLTANLNLRAALDRLGATLTASAEDTPAGFLSGEYSDTEMRCPAEALSQALPLLGRALVSVDISASEINRARQDLLSDMEAIKNDPIWVARAAAFRYAFPGWGPALGTAEELKEVTATEVREFLARTLVGTDVLIGVAAPADTSQLLTAAAQAFSAIRSQSSPSKIRAGVRNEKPTDEPESRIPMAGKTRVEIAAVSMGGPVAEYELPLPLLNYIVGETGYAGRLGRALTEPGLAYDVYSTQEYTPPAIMLQITTATAPADLDATLAAIRRELKSLSENGVEDWEVQEAKAYALGQMVLVLDQNLARALVDSKSQARELFDFPTRSLDVLSVSRDTLNRMARLYYSPVDFRFGLAGAVAPK